MSLLKDFIQYPRRIGRRSLVGLSITKCGIFRISGKLAEKHDLQNKKTAFVFFEREGKKRVALKFTQKDNNGYAVVKENTTKCLLIGITSFVKLFPDRIGHYIPTKSEEEKGEILIVFEKIGG